MTKKSNYTFKGTNVSIREHWTGEWEVFDSKTGEILYLVKNQQRALEVYDELNSVKK
ncbi:MAG: hypothetical protein II341_04895 [Oscillospiraceae bacterium]|nr:hypothetical protein [Oscillospiraceae bacterium]